MRIECVVLDTKIIYGSMLILLLYQIFTKVKTLEKLSIAVLNLFFSLDNEWIAINTKIYVVMKANHRWQEGNQSKIEVVSATVNSLS